MVQFRPKARELIAKVVYYGPPLCGKTTNLKSLYAGYPEDVRGELIIVPAGTDRTIFFDFLPLEIGTLRGMRVRVQLYTVPGQVHYNATRQVVLRGVDGIVFVADSQRQLLANNRESWENLKDNLLLQGMSLEEVPHVLQYNKRDLKELSSVAELDELLNDFSAPFFEAVAPEGIGVEETLQAIVKLVIRSLRDRFRLEGEPAMTQPVYYPPEATADETDAEVELGETPPDSAPASGLATPPAPLPRAAVFSGGTPAVSSPESLDAGLTPAGAGAPPLVSAQEEGGQTTTMAADITFAGAETEMEIAEPPFGVRTEGEAEPLDGEEWFEIARDGSEAAASVAAGEVLPEPAGNGSPASDDHAAGPTDEQEFVWSAAGAGDTDRDALADAPFEAPSEQGPMFVAEGHEDDFVQPVDDGEVGLAPGLPSAEPPGGAELERPRWGAEAAIAALKDEAVVAPPISDEVEALTASGEPQPVEPFDEAVQRREPDAPTPQPYGREPGETAPAAPDETGSGPFELQDVASNQLSTGEEVMPRGGVPTPFEVVFDSPPVLPAAPTGASGAPQGAAERGKTARTLTELAGLELDAGRGRPADDRPVPAFPAAGAATAREPVATVREVTAGEAPDPFLVAPPPPDLAGGDDVFAIVPGTAPGPPVPPESVVVPVEITAVKHAASRALARHGEVRELEVEVPVPAVWTGGRRMTFQLRLTLVPQEEDDDR